MEKRGSSSPNDVIALVGMSGRFPGARDVAQFWRNLRDGVESVREFSAEELENSGISREQLEDPDYVNMGAPLEDADCFDAAFFGYSPREAELMDPQQRLFLESAYSAIQDAGYDPARLESPVAVFGGVARNTYFIRNAEVYRSLMDEGALYEALLGTEKDFTATRVSFKLNLKGPGINVQGACSTSGIAVHLACQSLLSGECDMALAGGARVRVPLHAGYLYVEGGIPSPDGHCRAFDAGANGCVFGSGAAMLVLKRLEDAISDGDQIHALVLSTAINNDGSSKVGFTAPSVEGQAAVIEEALALAGVDAETIGYVEAHGTGTTLGDPIEIAALTRAFRQSSLRRNHCAIGSVKTNIGHLDAGAGAAGLIKAVLSLKHQQIPPSLNFSQANPQIDFDRSPFFVNDKLRPWEAAGTARRAGVSSFGLGGTNFHAVLEEAPALEPSSPGRPWQLLPLSARTGESLGRATSDLAEHLAHDPDLNLADVAYTLQIGRAAFEHRHFVVCSDLQHGVDQLNSGKLAQSSEHVGSDRPIVFMFPGQGSQYVNMGRELYELEPVFRSEIDACCDKLEPLLGFQLRDVLYPTEANEVAASEQLKQTSITQPALFVIEYALARLWQSWGIEPSAMIGHSVGEYTAATMANVLSVDDALRLLVARGKLMQQQAPGSMLAVQLSEQDVKPYLSDHVGLAACNAPSLSVLSGPTDAIAMVERKLADEGKSCRALMTSHAFHSAMMEPAVEPFLELARDVEFNLPNIPFISSLSGTWITDAQATSPEYWAQQLRQVVHFSRGVKELQSDPARVMLEVGPGRTLSMLTQQHRAEETPTTVVASLRHPRAEDPDLSCMLNALGQMWSAGVEIDWQRLHEGQHRRRVSLPTYPFERKRFWLKPKSSSNVHATPPGDPATAVETLSREQTSLSAEGTPPPNPAGPEVDDSRDRKTRIADEICVILHELSGVEPDRINQDATFLDMGFDSLFLTQANTAFQRKFKVKITFRQLFADAPTPDALAKFIDAQLPPEAFAPPPPSVQPTPGKTVDAARPAAPSITPPQAPIPAASVAGASELAGGANGNSKALSARDVIRQQMEVMHRQLDMLRVAGDVEQSDLQRLRLTQQQAIRSLGENKNGAPKRSDSEGKESSPSSTDEASFGPFRPVSRRLSDELTARQQEFLSSFTARFNRKTKSSKQYAQQNREQLADPRTVAGFRLAWKECVYPIVAKRSQGAYIWDLDGNKYVDLAVGFGVHMLGHSPRLINKAIQRQIKQGYSIGPQTTLAGEVAGLICEMTGMERACFCNTGSEAVLAAMRTARTVSGRNKVVTFSGDYHGIFDEVLGRNVTVDGKRRSLPVAPGILPEMLEHLVLLDYGDFNSLAEIQSLADDVAAVIVEPVRTRNPELQPREFLQALRQLTAQEDIALIFDEMVTGFRCDPGGAQAWFDVRADIATYGKVVGGGMPIGVVAGDAKYMDALDGGMWQYGDDSVPEAGVTWFAGTFVRHPLSLAASRATLKHLKAAGPALQEQLNARTERFADELNEYFVSVRAPMRIQQFSSFFLITFEACEEFSSLFYCCLREKGVHITENRAAFISTAHTDKDMRFLVEAFKSSVGELMEAGFLVPPTMASGGAAVASEAQQENQRIVTSTGNTRIPLTEGQSEIWLAAAAGDDVNCSFNLSYTLQLSGDLDVERLTMAVQHLVDRHESLRTIVDKDGQYQEVRRTLKADLVRHDLGNLKPPERETRLAELRDQAVTTPFDLANGPLFRPSLIRLAPREHLLFLTMHHIICDGYSSGTLLRHVSEIYSALCAGRAPSLPKPASFIDNVLRQRQDPDADQAESYWLDRYRNPPAAIDLPTDRPRPPVKTFAAGRLHHQLKTELSEAVTRCSAEQECTGFAVILAAFTAFLERLTGQQDVVVGIPSAGQAVYGEPDLVGHFANLLPIRVTARRDRSFLDHLDVTKRRLLDAFDHQGFTYGTLVKKLQLPRDPARVPLVSVVFNMDPESAPLKFGDLNAVSGSNPRRFENFDWFFNVLPRDGGMLLECTYNSEMFDDATMQLRLREFEEFLTAAMTESTTATGRLSLVPPEEQDLLESWNDTQQDFQLIASIHEMFEAQAARTPETVALIAEDLRLSYRELNERVNQLAAHLRELNVGPESLVGVNMKRSPEMVVAILAILKAGGAYVPLDPSYPAQRVRFMLEDSGAMVVVTQQELADDLPAHRAQLVCVDADGEAIGNQSRENPVSVTDSSHLAYVIYTSGSTGKPKGVAIEHRNAIALIQWAHDVFTAEELRGVLFSTSVCFDLSVFEMFVPLSTGGAIVLADNALHLLSMPAADEVTMVNSVPSAMTELLRAGDLPRGVTTVNLAGEPLTQQLVNQIYQQQHVRKVYDLYGPSEDTTYSTFALREAGGRYNIGQPIANTQAYLLDDEGSHVPVGVPGELYLGGSGLARGYLGRPELTAEKFVQSPLDPGQRLYRTGDLARWLVNGKLDYLGRIDHQVKIRGFRIELGEIESRLEQHDAVRQAVVVVHEPQPGDQRLAAYFASADGDRVPEAPLLRLHLRETLPDYMVPHYFVALPAIPLTPNGKVDRKALPDPQLVSGIPLPNATATVPSDRVLIPNMAETCAALSARAEELEREFDIMRLSDVTGLEKALNDLCRAHVCRYLVQCDPEFRLGAVRGVEAQRRTLGLQPAFRKFHNYMLGMLRDDGIIHREGARVTVVKDPVELSETKELEKQVLALCPQFGGTVELLEHCSRQFQPALSGEIPGISVLFVDGQRDFLERLLRQETIEHRNLRVYLALTRELVTKLAQQRPVRILEIGGGGGMLTWELAPAVKDLGVEYTFTDVGPSIVAATEREAAERGLDFIDFRTLDVTRDPTAQGFEPESYDIILGLNVVHATPDMDETLAQVKSLLSPGGFLGLIEYIKVPTWDHLIWGLTDGWWCFEDPYREDIALTDIPRWEKALRVQGLIDVSGIPTGSARDVTDAALILGVAPQPQPSEPTVVPELQPDASPRDALEMQLRNTWESLLHVKPIGIHDDFFDLGGHSLLAVQMMVQIEKLYGERLPLATLLHTRTVAGLADVLRSSNRNPSWGCLVPIRPGGSRPPLFLVHAAGGNVLIYEDLARRMPDDQPVYGLQSQGFDGRKPFHRTVEEMAAAYLQEIQRIQPHGPYMLGGYCMGGSVALEVATQLYERDEEVAVVALLDCHNWSKLPPASLGCRIYHEFQKLDFHWRNLWRLSARDKRRFLASKWNELIRRKEVWKDALIPNRSAKRSDTQIEGYLAQLWNNNEEAAIHYAPRPYPGRITHFCPIKNYFRLRNGEANWEDVAQGGVDVRTLPVYPAGMLMEPYVRQLADELTRSIEHGLESPAEEPRILETV